VRGQGRGCQGSWGHPTGAVVGGGRGLGAAYWDMGCWGTGVLGYGGTGI